MTFPQPLSDELDLAMNIVHGRFPLGAVPRKALPRPSKVILICVRGLRACPVHKSHAGIQPEHVRAGVRITPRDSQKEIGSCGVVSLAEPEIFQDEVDDVSLFDDFHVLVLS